MLSFRTARLQRAVGGPLPGGVQHRCGAVCRAEPPPHPAGTRAGGCCGVMARCSPSVFFFYYKKLPPDFQACHFFTFVGCHFEERRCTPRLHLKQPPEPEGPPDSHGTGAHAARAVIQRVYLKEVCSAATRAAIRPCLRGFWRVNHRAPMCVHSTAFYISMICNTTLGMQTFLKSI